MVLLQVLGWASYVLVVLFAISGFPYVIREYRSVRGRITFMGLFQWPASIAFSVVFALSSIPKIHLLWLIPFIVIISLTRIGMTIGKAIGIITSLLFFGGKCAFSGSMLLFPGENLPPICEDWIDQTLTFRFMEIDGIEPGSMGSARTVEAIFAAKKDILEQMLKGVSFQKAMSNHIRRVVLLANYRSCREKGLNDEESREKAFQDAQQMASFLEEGMPNGFLK